VLEAAKAADLTVTRPTRTAIRPSLVGKLVRIPRAAFGLAVLTIVLFCAVFAHWIVPFDPEEMDFDALLEGVSAVHLLGSDQLYSVHVKTRKLLTSERLLISASTRQPIFGFSRERSIAWKIHDGGARPGFVTSSRIEGVAP